MEFLLDFLRQPAPKAGTEMPLYYRRAMSLTQLSLSVYFAMCTFLLCGQTGQWLWIPVALCVATALCWRMIGKINVRAILGVCTAMVVGWCCWFVSVFGWSGGVQLFLLPLLVLIFFNIFERPWIKLVYSLALLIVRIGLFVFSQIHPAAHTLTPTANILLQMLNSVLVFVTLAINCILFSTNIQATERKLRMDNQQLHRQADTDPLTQLPNRRAMRDFIDFFMKESPGKGFCVAIADIDFFKKVNDTYGHNCGDYTLRQLSALFREAAGTEYSVCRWGGEEFCFFLPDQNLDQAGQAMIDLCSSVRKMPLSFEGTDFSITITIGVEEYDYNSPVDEILKKADEKLYLGKNSGRDQVVI